MINGRFANAKWLLVIAALLCGFIATKISFPAVQVSGAGNIKEINQKWEYKIITTPFGEKDIKPLGEQGWELVCVNHVNLTEGYQYVFKRAKH